MDIDGWTALSWYQSCHLSAPLSLTSFDLITPGITCNLVAIVEHVQEDPVRTSLVLTDYGTISIHLTVWRNRSRWVQATRPGSIVLVTDVYIKEYNSRLQATMTDLSRIFHLKAPVPPYSLIGTRVRELLEISNKLFPHRRPESAVGDECDQQRLFDSLEEAHTCVEGGIYIGLARIRICFALQSAAETGIQVVRRSSVNSSYEYRELPIIINDHIEGIASADVVRLLCANLSPSSVMTIDRDTVFQLLRCLNAPGNWPFYCRILSQVTLLPNKVQTRIFTLVSITW